MAVANPAIEATRRQRLRRSVVVPPQVFVVALALLLYLPTLPPTVLWGGGDFARDQVWAYTLHLEGGAVGHPLWTLVAHVFTWLPFGDIAYRVSLSSAVLAAVALALVFTAIYELVASYAGAWLGTAALAVSHTFWSFAVLPKVYVLNSLLLALAIVLAVRWERRHRPAYLYGLGVTLALGAYSHLLFFVLAPAFALYLLLTTRRRDAPHLVGVAVLYVAAAFPSLLMGRGGQYGEAGATGLTFVHQFLVVLVAPRSLALGLGVGAALLVYQFFLTLGAAATGLPGLLRRTPRVALLFGLLLLLDTAFVLSWIPVSPGLIGFAQNWPFFLPAYLVVAILAGMGFARLWPQLRGFARKIVVVCAIIVIPIAVYALAPRVAARALAHVGARSLPGRNNAIYLLSPWKQDETGARAFGRGVLDSLPGHARLLADYSIYWVVRYLQAVEGRRPDVQLVELPDSLAQQLPLALRQATHGRSLFIPDTNRYYAMAAFRRVFRIVPDGAVYELAR